MTPEERKAARVANLKVKPKRRSRRAVVVGDKLARQRKSLGVVGVRKMVVGAIQQQVEALRDRFLGEADRLYLLEALKSLALVEKVAKQPNNSAAGAGKTGDGLGSGSGVPLPPLNGKS